MEGVGKLLPNAAGTVLISATSSFPVQPSTNQTTHMSGFDVTHNAVTVMATMDGVLDWRLNLLTLSLPGRFPVLIFVRG
jgi:hypothetical protein